MEAQAQIESAGSVRSTIEAMRTEFRSVIRDGHRHAFCTVDDDIQSAAVERLNELMAKCEEFRKKAVEAADETAANDVLSMQYLAAAIARELMMWLYLKNGHTEDAWDSLVSAQKAVASAMRSSLRIGDLHSYAERLETIMTFIFPPQTFMSSSLVVESMTCSICDSEYGTCDHLMGMPYMGQLCSVRMGGIKDVREVAIVENPRDRRCRITESDFGDRPEDTLTHRTRERTEEEKDQAADGKNRKCKAIVLCAN